MANGHITPTTASLEGIGHDVREFDTSSAINQVHSSSSQLSAVAENQPLLIEACTLPSLPLAVAESGSTVHQIETPTSTAIVGPAIISKINLADNSSDVAITTFQDSPSATELVEAFRFLDLASETRNRIYHFVLGPPQDPAICLTEVLDYRPRGVQSGDIDFDSSFRPNSIKLNPKHKDPSWGAFSHQVKPHDLSILLVSKQIYVEAFHVFYTTNCFSFTDTGLLYRFLKNIGYTRRQHLTMVYFLWRGPDAKEAFRLLKTCRRLKMVQFTVPCSHPPGYEALKEVRVEKPKARALVHYTPAQNPPLNIREHTSCFGDYQCHCLCRRPYEPASSMRELEKAMGRPRREQDLPDREERFDLFKPKREHFKKSEEQDLLKEKATFDEFIGRLEEQGKELKYLGCRNRRKEAALNQTLTGPAVEDYFRDFADKLAKDKRLVKWRERYHAKRREEQEVKEREERWKREAIEEKELGIRMRKEARELKWKLAREAREHAKEMAREARELERRTAREAKDREKVMAREARARKKAAKEAKARGKQATSGTKSQKR